MSEFFAQVPPDSTGRKIRTQQVTENAQAVEMQVGVLSDPAGNLITSTLDGGGKQALDVNVANTSVAVTNANLDVALSTRTKPSDQQHVIADSGTITTVSAVTAITNALPAGTNVIGHVITDTGSTTAVTGTVTVDGSGHTQPVSGTVTANAGSGTFTNQQSNVTADYDSGAGTQNLTMFGVALPASGGAVAGGTAANPVRTDPTGTTTQPVSGTVTANAGTNLNTSALALETGGNLATLAGAVTSAVVQSNTKQINGVAPSMGNGVSGTGVQRVTLASDSTGQVALAAGAAIIGALTANQSVNVAQVAGNTTDTNSGNKSAGTQRVVIATDQPSLTNALPVSQATAANLNATIVGTASDNSADSTAKLPVLPARANASSPSWTEGNQVPLSTDLTGALRVSGAAGGGVAQTQVRNGSNAWTDVGYNAGDLNMPIQSPTPALTTMQNGATANGNGTSLPVGGYANAILNVTASVGMSGGTTINFEATVDNTTWVPIFATTVGANTLASTTTVTNDFSIACAGYTNLRARISAYSAGTITVKGYAATLAGAQPVVNANQAGTWTVQPGNTANTTAWKVDGSAVTQPVSVASLPALPANQSVNVAQINAVTPLMGNGVSGTGAQRVTIASDSTGQIALAAGAAVIGHVIADSGSTTAVTGNVTVQQATASNLNAQVVGAAASGAAKAGNPVQMGMVFNTTQPTVTTGQAVEAQGTARGAQIVSTGVDTFNVTVNAAIAAGTNVIGHVIADTGSTTAVTGNVTVQQATGTNLHAVLDANSGVDIGKLTLHQSANVDQLNGTTADTNSGTKSAGTLRVVLATDQPALTNKLLVTPDANSAINVAQVSGSTVSTAATGVQKVGVVGNAGATVDSTVGAGTAPTNAVAVAQVYNTSAPAPTNGQAMAVQADQAGNERVFSGIALAALSAWNSGTSVNATQNIFTNSGADSVLVHLVQTTTITVGAITFEVSYDNSNWVTAPAMTVLDPSSNTFAQISLPYTLVASTNKPFLIEMNGAQALRIKLSTAITGSGTVTPNYALLNFSPVQNVIALSPTAANFNVTLGTGGNTIGALSANQSVNNAQVSGTAVDVNSGNKSAGTMRVVLATDQPQLTNKLLVTPDANSAVNVAQINGVTTLMGNGTTGTGSQRVTIASDNTAFSVNASLVPATSGGLTISRTLSVANTTGTSIKGSAGQLYGWACTNTNAAARFVKLYNKATAPTVGTDTPVMTILVPGNTAGAGTNFNSDNGIAFGTGIGLGITGAVTDADTTAPAANEVVCHLFYK